MKARDLEFKACARLTDTTDSTTERIKIITGEGIGTVVRDGFEIKKGYPAINPVPMHQTLALARHICLVFKDMKIEM
ncbi:MAG TPA: hypothetical protein C5S51_04810 [Methanosarcinaceae archaeon]|nr:hypothetical protein [Methanosarcinaceae archaeon]